MESFVDFLSSPQGMLLSAAAAFGIGWLLFGADSRIEDRRRRAIELSGKLRQVGFTKLPVFLEDYAVGDYSGMVRSIKELHDIMHDPAQRAAELDRVVKLVLEMKFKDPEQRAAVLKLVDDLKSATESGKKPLDTAPQLISDAAALIRTGPLAIDASATPSVPQAPPSAPTLPVVPDGHVITMAGPGATLPQPAAAAAAAAASSA